MAGGVIDDAALYDRMLASMEAFFGHVGDNGPGGRTIRRPGVVASVCPAVPHRSVFNSVVYHSKAALEEALDDLAAAYDGAGVIAWTVWTPQGDSAARAAIGRAGNVLDAGDGAQGLDWERAGTAQDMCAVLESSFGWEMAQTAEVFARLPEHGHVYVARVDGRPAACVAALDADGDCGIWNVGTLAQARGRGLATGLMRQALADARGRGCTTTSLQATMMGRPVYARLGYRDLGAIEMWERRRQPGAGTT